MELFLTIINSFPSLTVVTKNFILDVAGVQNPLLVFVKLTFLKLY